MDQNYEIDLKYIEAMLQHLYHNLEQDNIDDNIEMAKTVFAMIFDSDILYQNHNKTSFNTKFELVLSMFYENCPNDFQEFIDKMNNFHSDMISFDSIKVTDVKVY